MQLGLLLQGVLSQAHERLVARELGAADEVSVHRGGVDVSRIAAIVIVLNCLNVITVLSKLLNLGRRVLKARLRRHVDSLDVLLNILVELRGVSLVEVVGGMERVLGIVRGIRFLKSLQVFVVQVAGIADLGHLALILRRLWGSDLSLVSFSGARLSRVEVQIDNIEFLLACFDELEVQLLIVVLELSEAVSLRGVHFVLPRIGVSIQGAHTG